MLFRSPPRLRYGLLLAFHRVNTGVHFYDVALDGGWLGHGMGHVDVVLIDHWLRVALFQLVASSVSE